MPIFGTRRDLLVAQLCKETHLYAPAHLSCRSYDQSATILDQPSGNPLKSLRPCVIGAPLAVLFSFNCSTRNWSAALGDAPIQSALPNLWYYRLTLTCRLTMPGGSSATKEEPARSGPPPSLLGVTGGAGQDNQATDPTTGSWSVSPATAIVAEGACRWEKYSLLVRIFTARGRRSLEPHAWVEDLLKDFFQSILGINLSVILLSPTECLIFCGNRAQGQGMSWDESLQYAHQLMGVHPWTGYMIEVVAYQWTLKEARHEMQVAREFTHERTKQRITHLNALAMVPALRARLATPQGSPRGRGMMRRAD